MLTLAQGRVPAQTSPPRHDLTSGWQLCATEPGHIAQPDTLTTDLPWLEVPALGPVADVLRQLGRWSLDGESRRFDAQDWWYRLRFDAPDGFQDRAVTLGLDGLATLAEVWLNGQAILSSHNMFVAHRVALDQPLRPTGNELVLVCRALDHALGSRRPRPRWRAPMIENQQLRWFRTTLLGRTPGWSPPAAVVGPWRGIWLAAKPEVELIELDLLSRVVDQAGVLDIACALKADDVARPIEQVWLNLKRGALQHRVALTSSGAWTGQLRVDQVQLWWPHTHGTPALYDVQLEILRQGQTHTEALDLGRIGFRTVEVDRAHDGFALRINGVPVFCRGACWTPLDPVTLDAASEQDYALALAQLKDAGMNMVRVPGTMSYEADAFYTQCDQQGILVWQDFMFANMDYPQEPDFIASVRTEVRQQLRRWQARPSLAILCGNSEVEQQAAMFGATRDHWAPPLFHDTLAAEAAAVCPDVPYWPSSAHGGAFPHQGDVGTTSYYGVGAYLRDQNDARRANLRFATECLAFSNIPESTAISQMPGGLALRVHHAAWKARAPRDLGAGWDFEDVRDHYMGQLFSVDPARLRYSDHDRYLALGRVATGEVMAAAMGEWRREASTCYGALIWFLRDLWPGAGWGVIDSQGQPKAAYHYLKRALQAVSVTMSDEGGNGLYVHVANDGPQGLHAHVEVTAWRHGHVQVGQGRQAIKVPAHAAQSWPLMAWFDWFADWSWAYRFGPPSAQVLMATLLGAQGEVLSRCFAFPTGLALPLERNLGLRATARAMGDGVFELTVSTERFAQSVHFDVDAHVSDDAYFHLAPGAQQRVLMRPLPGTKGAQAGLIGCVRALNSDMLVTIEMAPDDGLTDV